MKVRVNRTLQSGTYLVSFAFSDFTQEELAKMRSFGVPIIQIKMGGPVGQAAVNVAINQVNPNMVAGFADEENAKNYEASVLTQAKGAMQALRLRKDDFSSTAEVEI